MARVEASSSSAGAPNERSSRLKREKDATDACSASATAVHCETIRASSLPGRDDPVGLGTSCAQPLPAVVLARLTSQSTANGRPEQAMAALAGSSPSAEGPFFLPVQNMI